LIRVADDIAQRLAEHGVRHVFMVTGGGAMHLNDAFGRRREFDVLCCHHEQACAMAAESYFRHSGRLAAVCVTSGPGGLNALNGVHGAFTDSMGMIVVSGQVKRETLARLSGVPGLRQLGDQEVDIVGVARGITKYAVTLEDPLSVRYYVERALRIATSGRPGPVWIDVPMDVQGAPIDPAACPAYDPAEDALERGSADLASAARQLVERLQQARRPVLLPGSGVRISGAQELLRRVAERLSLPVATAFNAHDLLEDDHSCLVGRPGTVGDRAGNFAVQNADFLLVLGCRLNIRQIGYNWAAWAPRAFKAMVDIDPREMAKPTLAIDLPIHADVRELLAALLEACPAEGRPEHRDYLAWCRERRAQYPAVPAGDAAPESLVHPYRFTRALFASLPEDQTVVTGDGTACVATFQAAALKRGQRLYSNSGAASMGYDLPAAIGACLAMDRRPPTSHVVCLAGDGSIMMNLQELQTIAWNRLPIAVFVYNNAGYHSIRQTQTTYFPDGLIGFDAASGVGFPDFGKVAAAFGLPYTRIASHAEIEPGIRKTLETPGPVLCEVVLDPSVPFAPKPSSRRLGDGRMVSAPLDDQWPFLPPEELALNRLP
jgi:acetolactate synthase-1/2/3 large subunit